MNNMTAAGIVGLGYYVPPKIMTNYDWENIVDTSDEWITSKTGIKERRIADKDICTSDLAVMASIEAMREAKVRPEDIDLIILATSSPDVPLSSTASITQHKLGCKNAGAFDINAVCSGWVHALEIGSKFVIDSNYDNVLVIGSEVYSRIVNWEDRATCVLFGDGAGAAILQKIENGRGIIGSWLKSDGSGAEVIQIPAGGIKKPISSSDSLEGEQYFHMDGRAVWNFAIEAFPQAVKELLKQINMEIKDIDMIIPHQANFNIIKAGMENLGLPMDKVFMNLDKYGNTAAASVPIALAESVKEGIIKPGDLVITVGFGGGLAWGANAIEW
jgi:3-oxoacyl-[acyl-carrier-protein] synthase-3|tara:strand:+ start:7689 stop:8678 length:990 start_codon:yes stop_codon:yes gene_type:complete